MYLRIPQIFPDIREQHLHLIWIPLQQLNEQPQRERLKTLFDLNQIPRSNRFLPHFSYNDLGSKGKEEQEREHTKCLSFGHGPIGNRNF